MILDILRNMFYTVCLKHWLIKTKNLHTNLPTLTMHSVCAMFLQLRPVFNASKRDSVGNKQFKIKKYGHVYFTLKHLVTCDSGSISLHLDDQYEQGHEEAPLTKMPPWTVRCIYGATRRFWRKIKYKGMFCVQIEKVIVQMEQSGRNWNRDLHDHLK